MDEQSRSKLIVHLVASSAELLYASGMAEQAQLTIYQTEQLNATLGAMAKTSEKLSKLLAAVYGDCNPRTVRCRELAAAAIGLKWVMANGETPLPAIV